MSLAAAQQAIFSFVQTASGLAAGQVVWDGQQASAPDGQFIKIRMGDILALGARDELKTTTVQAWATGTVYGVGDQVSYGGNLWAVTVAGAGTSTVAPPGGADGYTWNNLGAIAGQEIDQKAIGRREFDLTVQCFGGAGQEAGDSSPAAVLSAVRAALTLPSKRAALSVAGLTCFDPGSVCNVAAVAGTIFEPRAIFEGRWYINEKVDENTGYIETVNAVGTITNPGDPLSPFTVDVTATSP